MIRTFVIPQINNENVIQFINESYAKLKSANRTSLSRQNSFISLGDNMTSSIIIQSKETEEEAWYELLDCCLNYIACGDLISILKQQKSQHQIPKAILEEVIERIHK